MQNCEVNNRSIWIPFYYLNGKIFQLLFVIAIGTLIFNKKIFSMSHNQSEVFDLIFEIPPPSLCTGSFFRKPL